MKSEERAGVPAPARVPINDKLMHTFRLPRPLVLFLKAEAAESGRDLTSQVIRCLDGVRTYCGLPGAATALLEADRGRLGLDRYEYLLHTLYQRSLQVREAGPGFDGPRAEQERPLGYVASGGARSAGPLEP